MNKKNVALNKTLLLTVKLMLAISILYDFGIRSYAQVNHKYPKVGIFRFGKAAPVEWYAKFDLVITSNTSSSFVNSIKAINPKTKVLWTVDWNAGARINNFNIPEEWRVKDSNGNYIKIYGLSRYLADITDYCLLSSDYGNKKYNEYLREYLVSVADLSVFDGMSNDGAWRKPYVSGDIDLDRNGVNDYDEYGAFWVQNVWQNGIEKALEGVREEIGNNEIIVFNPGGMQEFRSSIIRQLNGIYSEDTKAIYSYQNFKNVYNTYSNNVISPHCTLIDGMGDKKDQYSRMRFFVGITLMADGYASFTETASGEHHYKCYYDEYDLDLGEPTSSPTLIYSSGSNDQGVYVRFFENGVVIVNVDNEPHTISDGDISAFSKYDGPYYRFKGGQDPDFNNGKIFKSVTLDGKVIDNKGGYVGDAIFLLEQPTTAITEIIIDSDNDGTSPGSLEAQYTGTWIKTNDMDKAWCLNYRSYEDAWAIEYSLPGSGENTAIFTPTIGVAGFYKVYEWHGDLPQAQEANDVPYEIHHANGTAFGVIDQTKNYGKWNYLGTYNFNVGTDGYVKISNNANGIVVADAFKFVYDESGGDVDNIPPNPPKNLRSESETENTITLAWERPNQASDGDYASSYQIMRNGTVLGYTFYQTYTDTGLVENTTYTYSIYALDDYGNLSTSPATGQFTTSSDQTPPTVDSVRALNSSLVSIVFSEPVELSSAENANNYSVNNNIIISSASLLNDNKTVQLTTSKHSVGVTYTITINNIYDRASVPNIIALNTTVNYNGVGDPIIISLSADNNYELYVNGEFLGSDARWQEAETYYYIPQQIGKKVIAVKCWDNVTTGGFVAEITFEDNIFVTNESWKVTTVEEAGWKTLTFNDQLWEQATSYGLHGEAEPWAQYGNVQGISTDAGVKWIWSSDNQNDKVVYFRFTINEGPDQTPPAPPTGIIVVEPQK